MFLVFGVIVNHIAMHACIRRIIFVIGVVVCFHRSMVATRRTIWRVDPRKIIEQDIAV